MCRETFQICAMFELLQSSLLAKMKRNVHLKSSPCLLDLRATGDTDCLFTFQVTIWRSVPRVTPAVLKRWKRSTACKVKTISKVWSVNSAIICKPSLHPVTRSLMVCDLNCMYEVTAVLCDRFSDVFCALSTSVLSPDVVVGMVEGGFQRQVKQLALASVY